MFDKSSEILMALEEEAKLSLGDLIKFPKRITGVPVTGRCVTTGLLAGAVLLGVTLLVGEALAVGDTAVGDGVVVPPQAVSATSRIQTEIAISLLPRLNAVFFTAILLLSIFPK